MYLMHGHDNEVEFLDIYIYTRNFVTSKIYVGETLELGSNFSPDITGQLTDT